MPKNGFKYSKHALDRMFQRGITKEETKEAILKAQTRKPQSDGTIKAIYKKNRKVLVVIYTTEGSNVKIVSTF